MRMTMIAVAFVAKLCADALPDAAPGFLILLLLFAPLILCRRTRRSRSWQNDKMVIKENRYDNI